MCYTVTATSNGPYRSKIYSVSRFLLYLFGSWFIFKARILTLSFLQANTDTFANSVDPDETAHNEPSHQDLHCLLFYY